ncbi:Sec61beta family-domain-containing protein [Tricladium varicosporioides]|nr:Sec61beta family-domain-containing protein [Hymenoscyphus varicosporioides]
MSSPRASSPVNSPAALGSSTGRPSSPTPPGGPKTAIRRRAAADQKDKVANARPSSTRAAGAGGSSSTMLRLYTDESPGLKVDPVVVLVLSIVFIFSVVALHTHKKILQLDEAMNLGLLGRVAEKIRVGFLETGGRKCIRFINLVWSSGLVDNTVWASTCYVKARDKVYYKQAILRDKSG